MGDKLHAISAGSITINGTDHGPTTGNIKFSHKLVELWQMSDTVPGWRIVVPGGGCGADGSVSFPWDTTNCGSGTFPAPLTISLVSMIVNVGAKTLTFQAGIENLEINKDVGDAGKLVECSCDFKSSGAVTFA